jgi:hypothetical protein
VARHASDSPSCFKLKDSSSLKRVKGHNTFFSSNNQIQFAQCTLTINLSKAITQFPDKLQAQKKNYEFRKQ